jgi:hypothetical protein
MNALTLFLPFGEGTFFFFLTIYVRVSCRFLINVLYLMRTFLFNPSLIFSHKWIWNLKLYIWFFFLIFMLRCWIIMIDFLFFLFFFLRCKRTVLLGKESKTGEKAEEGLEEKASLNSWDKCHLFFILLGLILIVILMKLIF